MFKLLLKRSFKGLFKHKVFSILLIALIILSGAIYTILESVSSSFNESYTEVINDGKLHDFVIKENFRQSKDSKFEVKGVSPSKSLYELTDENIKKNVQRYAGEYSITLGVDEAQGDFDNPNITSQITRVKFEYDGKKLTIKNKLKLNEAKSNFRSTIESNAKQKLAINFMNALKKKYDQELFLKETHSISVSANDKAFKVVRYNNVPGINELVINDGTSLFTKEVPTDELKERLIDEMKTNGKKIDNYFFSTIKGFKVVAKDRMKDSISKIDPSSYQAVVSPAYANINQKTSITPTEFQEILKHHPRFLVKPEGPKKESLSKNEYERLLEKYEKSLAEYKKLLKKYKNNLIFVNTLPFIIIGIGTTPDFSNPIIDGMHPTVDVEKQAIVFTNNRGFERTYDSFRTNAQENYISAKFKDGVSSSRKKAIKNEIEHFARGQDANGKSIRDSINYPTSAWPRNVKIVTAWDDSNDQLLLTQERVIFLKQLKNTIRTVSLMTTLMLVLLVGLIVIWILQAIVAINKKQFATLLSLGMSKWKLGLSEAIAFTTLIGISAIFSYGIGYGLQFVTINAFSNYWTIPTYGVSFSLTSLLVTVSLPLLFIGVTILFITVLSLRHPLPEMLKGKNDQANITLTKIISKIKMVGITGRYAIALTTKNTWKIFSIFMTSAISITAIIIGISSFGKGLAAYNETANVQKFSFRVNLDSPTQEGGQYGTINYNDLTNNNIVPMEQTYNDDGTKNVNTNKPHWHIPGIGDAKYGIASSAKNNIISASSYLKNKLQIKTFLDQKIHGGGINPWNIAKKLMPENQLNKTLEDSALVDDLEKRGIKEKEAVKKVISYHTNDENRSSPYIISYNNVIIDPGDEKYTYLDTSFNSEKLSIIGVGANTKMVEINDELNALKSSKDQLPILINKYIAKKHHFAVGSSINFIINNDVTRNFKNHKEHIVKGIVRGIVNGYNDSGIYTLRSKANKILGLDKISGGNVNSGFNGIFSKNKNPAIINTLPLYSESGLYPGTDSLSGKWNSVLRKMMQNPNVWKYSSQITNKQSKFMDIYSATPFVTVISNVSWDKMNEYTFKNISKLISFIIISIESISIILALLFTIIITSLLIRANYSKIATLWTMGYRKWEISKIFLAMYVLPVLLAGFISSFIGYWILVGMMTFTMNFGHILIPFAMAWWIPFVAIFIIFILFTLITFISIARMRADTALAAFKEE